MYYLNQKIENLVRIFDQNERKGYVLHKILPKTLKRHQSHLFQIP